MDKNLNERDGNGGDFELEHIGTGFLELQDGVDETRTIRSVFEHVQRFGVADQDQRPVNDAQRQPRIALLRHHTLQYLRFVRQQEACRNEGIKGGGGGLVGFLRFKINCTRLTFSFSFLLFGSYLRLRSLAKSDTFSSMARRYFSWSTSS